MKVQVAYIGGWGRSGSTLLDRFLGQTPGTVSVGEMRDVWLRGVLENRRCGCGEPFLSCPFWVSVGDEAFDGWSKAHAVAMHRLRMRFDRPWMTPLLLTDRVATPDLRTYVAALGHLYRGVSTVADAHMIIDSTKIPSYALLLRKVSQIDMKFVHLVRDSRGVVYSWQKSIVKPDSTTTPDEMLRYGLMSASGRYLLYNALAESLKRTSTPYLFIRYEDLVREPARVLGDVLRFLGQPDEVDFLEAGTATLGVNHTVDGNPSRFSGGAIRVRLDDEWTRKLSTSDIRRISAMTAPLLRRYGYSVVPKGISASGR